MLQPARPRAYIQQEIIRLFIRPVKDVSSDIQYSSSQLREMTLYDLTFVDRQKFCSNYQGTLLIQWKEKGSVF